MKAHGFCNTFGANHKTSLLDSNLCADANEPSAVMSSLNAFHSLPHIIQQHEWAMTQNTRMDTITCQSTKTKCYRQNTDTSIFKHSTWQTTKGSGEVAIPNQSFTAIRLNIMNYRVQIKIWRFVQLFMLKNFHIYHRTKKECGAHFEG